MRRRSAVDLALVPSTALVVLAALAGSPAEARADDVHELRHDVATDAVVTVTSVVVIASAEAGKAGVAPASCAWCDDELNGLDRGARDALKWDSTRTAARLSDAIGAVGAPAVSLGTLFLAGSDAGASRRFGVDALLLAEPVMVSGVLNEIVKLGAGRERPFVHALPASEKSKTPHPADNNLSFYSGHTSSTMAMAAAGGTIATLRGYRLAPLVWGAGAAVGAFTGYLRIAADKHYLTDVIVGAIVGTAIGISVPVLFHGRRDDVAPKPLGSSSSSPAAAPPAMLTLGAAF